MFLMKSVVAVDNESRLDEKLALCHCNALKLNKNKVNEQFIHAVLGFPEPKRKPNFFPPYEWPPYKK